MAVRRAACCACVALLAWLAVPAAAHAEKRTVGRELERLHAAGALDDAGYAERLAAWKDARASLRRLEGRRRLELGGVMGTIEAIAARGELTAGRVTPLWLTLARNVEWWTTRPLLASGQRVGFAGSELVWQYYPGQGVQLQVLASFGKLNGLWEGRRYDLRMAHLLDELLALRVERAGAVTWEYMFDYAGGRAPWVSAMAQGTALQALARASLRLGRQAEVVPIAQQGLRLFEVDAPEGVRVADGADAHYLLYSFRPGLKVLNGFLQALIGLYDFAALTGDERARALYATGEAAAQREVPAYDTGAWSLYSRGAVRRESDLGYHTLVRDFLGGLCRRTGTAVYCATRDRFTAYLTQPPQVALRSQRLRGGRWARLGFRLSKISRVSVRVTTRAGAPVLGTSPLALGRGPRSVAWKVPRKAGLYVVTVSAVDLAGNAGSAQGFVRVLKPRRRP